MKKILIFLSFLIVTISFIGCEKVKDTLIIKNAADVQQNTLSAITGSPVVLIKDSAATNFQTFKWTAVDFGFPAAVTYTVQVDKKGNNFASEVDVVTVTGILSASETKGDLNKILLGLAIDPETAADVEFRVKAVVNSAVAPVYSTVVSANVTPYATSFPPIYMCGKATGGWDWNLYDYKEIRSSSYKIYETVSYFLNTGSDCTFRFFKQTDWSPTAYNYPYFTGTISPLLVNANDGDKNFQFTGTTGYYDILVDMKTLSVSMTPVDEPVLYATGGALGGWDWDTHYVKLTWKSNGIFQFTAAFSNDIFRFFKQLGWGNGYNYNDFAGGSVSPLLVLNTGDSDNNFKFIGTPGNYTVTVNLLDKIITMVPVTK